MQTESPHLIDSFDHAGDSVPLTERRDPLTMGLLWITMVTGFPTVLIGFEWFRLGFTLQQVLWGAGLSCVIVLVYALPAAYLGSKSGLTYALLTRNTFGRWGSRLVSANFVWIAMAWYALAANFLAMGLKALFHWDIPNAALGALFAILMAFNNFFGFSGVANFAKYVAGPVLLIWVGYTFCKVSGSCPATIWEVPAQHGFSYMISIVSSFVIGYAVWGNEADYWRYGRPRLALAAIPMAVAVAIGQILFPATGWLMAYTFKVTEIGAATELMNRYAFGGLPWLAAAVLAICYFAITDSGLYGAVNTTENLKKYPRKYVVALLALAGAGIAALIANDSNAFASIASLSCVFLPCSTVIIVLDVMVLNRLFGVQQNLTAVPEFAALPPVRWPAVGALLAGYLAGILTSGLIPGTAWLHQGVPAVQSWLVSMVIFAIARGAQLKGLTNRCAGETE